MTHRNRHNRGYVLIVTLAALVVTATALMTLMRATIGHASEARVAADELQRRWGMISCRQAVLPNAEYVLAYREARSHRPAASVTVTISLGSQHFQLLIGDEQAKANVNAILSDADRPLAEDRIRRGLSSAGASSVIRLRPAIVGNNSSPTTRPFAETVHGWGQITDATYPVAIIDGPARELTCWGDGRINVARASAESLSLASPKLLQTDIQRLIRTRAEVMNPQAHLVNFDANNVRPSGNPALHLLQLAGIDPSRAGGFTTQSACHSLWICSDDGRRVWYDLAVLDDSDPNEPRVVCFSW